MSSEYSIRAEHIGKCYHIYDRPRDRLMQMLWGRRRLYYREFWALRDVSFAVRKGETVGIVGRNGSGKSTLLQIVCGTLSPTTGSVTADGRIAALLELGSGFNPEFTGRENVFLNAALLGLSPDQIEERFADIAKFADISAFLDQPVKSYSSGMVVRLAFAVAVHTDPQILVVDEALSVGDEAFQRKCFARIEAIRDAGATILFVSHSGGMVVELCDRVILLDAGERLLTGSPKHVVGLYQKLLYVPDDRHAEVRAQIRAMDESSSTSAGTLPEENVADAVAKAAAPAAPAPDEAAYDPHLVPASTIAYESHGVLISDPVIQTLDGRSVNVLRRGESYRYQYHARFSVPVSKVRFGMMLKTTTGVELGGAVSAGSSRSALHQVAAGSTFTVAFDFTCRLATGVYFVNAGIVGEVDGREIYLHRLVDAAMFRVMPEKESTVTGTVDFGCVATVRAGVVS